MANKGERYSKETAEKIIGLFSSLPPSDEGMNTESFVQYIKDAVVEMQRKGYSNESIANLLQENGIKIKPGTLKTYLSSKKAGRTRTRRASGHAPARAGHDNGNTNGNTTVNASGNELGKKKVDTNAGDDVNTTSNAKPSTAAAVAQATAEKIQTGQETGHLKKRRDVDNI